MPQSKKRVTCNACIKEVTDGIRCTQYNDACVPVEVYICPACLKEALENDEVLIYSPTVSVYDFYTPDLDPMPSANSCYLFTVERLNKIMKKLGL